MDVSLSYHEFTEALVTTFGISRGEMHMHAGLLICKRCSVPTLRG